MPAGPGFGHARARARAVPRAGVPEPPGRSDQTLPGGCGGWRGPRADRGRDQTRPAKSGAQLAMVWVRTPTLGLAASTYLPSPM